MVVLEHSREAREPKERGASGVPCDLTGIDVCSGEDRVVGGCC